MWYHGDPAGRWAEFRRKYLDELGSSAAVQDFLDRIRTYPDVTLLYASKNRVENHAVILKEFIEKNLNSTVLPFWQRARKITLPGPLIEGSSKCL